MDQRVICIFQVQDSIKFQYTNWSSPESDESRFSLLTKLVGDSQYDCPVDSVAEMLAGEGGEGDGRQVFR